MSVEVFLDGVDVTDCEGLEGSATRRLNRPAQAQVKAPMDCASGGPGSRLKIKFNGNLFFHGMVMNCETDAGEDDGYTVYNATDPMELWQWRPVRDDDCDFSKPTLFNGIDITQDPASGNDMMEAVLTNTQSCGSTDDDDCEGPIFLDLGSFEAAGTDISGFPADWPQTIAEFWTLLSSTGTVDLVITPTDPGGGVMGTIDGFNGDYGNDLSGSVNFDYGMGDHNVRRLRWNEDMSQICNKLWYYGGPRVGTPADPAGDQHWCFNITGDDSALAGYPSDPPYSVVAACRGDGAQPEDLTGSRATYGVRMEVKIFDAVGENCAVPGVVASRELYRWLWLAESYLRCGPRQLVHVTPTRNDSIGAFDIGDLVTVNIGSQVRGGATGVQRIYQYTISWDAEGVLALDELQTSPSNEGFL